MTEQLRRWANSRGYEVGWAPIAVAQSALQDVERRRASGEIDSALAKGYLAFDSPQSSDASVLAVILPRPAHRVTFMLGNRRFDTILPPTYQRYRPTFEDLRRDISANALPARTVETLEVPQKNVAARLGLVRYGRNNVTYSPSFGSYLQIAVYVVTPELPSDGECKVREPELMEECETCCVCEAVCPTEAVTSDRMLVHAERCLTYANEQAGEWPAWTSETIHHCLLGCLRCQENCPCNPELPVEDSGVVFGREETDALLNEGEHSGAPWKTIREKLAVLGQSYSEPVIGRNLRALLQAPRIER